MTTVIPEMDMSTHGVRITRRGRLLLSCACAVILGFTAYRLYHVLPDDAGLSLMAGSWTTMAADFADGVFYRPLIGPDGYGGTRFFPLHFVLHGVLIKAGLEPIRAGYVIALASGVGLVAGAFLLLKRLGCGRFVSATAALLLLSPASVQMGLTTVRGDLLPAALSMWGLVFATGLLRDNRRVLNEPLAALFFALAFAAKITSVFALGATIVALLISRKPSGLLRLAGWFAAFSILFVGAACLFSGGRLLAYLRQCGSAGTDFAVLARTPLRLISAFGEDPMGLFCVLLAGALLTAGPWRLLKSLPSVFFIIAAIGTIALFTTDGIGPNHLVDIEVAAILLIAVAASHADARSEAPLHLLAIMAVTFSGYLFVKGYYRDHQPLRDNCRDVVALTQKGEGPLLAENPIIPILADERPYMTDAFMFRVLSERYPEFGSDLEQKLSEKTFRAVVLDEDSDPSTEAGLQKLDERHFGKGFASALAANYALAHRKHDFLIYLPMQPPVSEQLPAVE